MTPTETFLGATAMSTGAGADADDRPSESGAPGMKAEPNRDGITSMVSGIKRICVRMGARHENLHRGQERGTKSDA